MCVDKESILGPEQRSEKATWHAFCFSIGYIRLCIHGAFPGAWEFSRVVEFVTLCFGAGSMFVPASSVPLAR
jgi:hypothetical protein